MDIEKIKEELKEELKEENKKRQRIKNKLLKFLENEIKNTKDFQYCKQGNENYLNDIIQTILLNKINYLNTVKNEIIGI